MDESKGSTLKYQPYYRRYMPHIQPPGATFFVTFRLVNSLPKSVLEELKAAVEMGDKATEEIGDETNRENIEYQKYLRQFGRFDAALDNNRSGPHWLRDEAVANMVVESLNYRNGRQYELITFCIMSNHVHIVFKPLPKDDGEYYALSTIMHSLKGNTARNANRLLNRNGRFWQPESYDHFVRDEAELGRIIRYVLNNPVKAGLVEEWGDWPWSYVKDGLEVSIL